MKLSVVVPVYKEADNIDSFCQNTCAALERHTQDYEIIFAIDPSPDHTEEKIITWNKKEPRVKFLTFSRRIGQPLATIGGLSQTSGDAVIVMDVDLQDPPELISQMIAKWEQGFDVVYAQRISRKGETLIKRVIAYVGYKVINRLANVNIPPNTGDFRLMSRRVVDSVIHLKESHGFLRGMVALVGFRQTSIQFERPRRNAGKGNYNRFFGSLRIGLNGLFCFSSALLSATSLMGFAIAFFAFILAFIYLVLKLRGVPFPMGNPTIVILVLFLGGIQLISVGVLGEYIGRIYDEVKQRPKFIVDKKVGF